MPPLTPTDIPEVIHTAICCQQAGDFQQAELLYQEILKTDPENTDALHLLGLMSLQLGDTETAYALISQALALSNNDPLYLHSYGNVLKTQGRFDEALAVYEKILTLNEASREPFGTDSADVCVDMGDVCFQKRDYAQATEYYQRVLKQDWKHPAAHAGMGDLHAVWGDFEKSAQSYKQATQWDPNFDLAWAKLSAIYAETGKYAEAIPALTKAIELNPYNDLYHCQLGHMLHGKLQLDLAIKSYGLAVQLNPTCFEAYLGMGQACEIQGKTAEALKAYQEAYRIFPTDGLKVKMATILPAVYSSKEHLEESRDRFIHNIQELLKTPLNIANPVTEVGLTPFFLAYQGQDDRELLQTFNRLYQSAVKNYPEVVGVQNKKPRIGFISRFFYPGHTIHKLNQGLIQQLSRERFDVCVFHVGFDYPAKVGRYDNSDRYINLPMRELDKARQMIVDEQLDLLVYLDIGMDPMTYALSLSRLAKKQCVLWGHPETTGNPNMDLFVSSALIEPESSQQHYSEQLYKLASLPAYYERPTLERPATKTNFGLQETDHLYLCPQSLYKCHPDFDAALGDILRRDLQGKLVLVKPSQSHHWQLLMARFERTMPDVLDRVFWVNSLCESDFLRLLSVADVILDPFYFGSGNTAYESFAVGVPVVTMPGAYMRGRAVDGCYRKMEISGSVAKTPDEYVTLAVRLGTDPLVRQTLVDEINANSYQLYGDETFIREFTEFIQKTTEDDA